MQWVSNKLSYFKILSLAILYWTKGRGCGEIARNVYNLSLNFLITQTGTVDAKQ